MDFFATTCAQDEFDLTKQGNIDVIYALENITDAMQHLDNTSPITRLDLNFTPNDNHILEQFKMTNLTNRMQHIACIPQLNYLDKEMDNNSLDQFLRSIAPDSPIDQIDYIANLVSTILNTIALSLSKHAYGIFILQAEPSSLGTSMHTDPTLCYNDATAASFMFIAPLKGISTLYYTGSYDYTQEKICIPENNLEVLLYMRSKNTLLRSSTSLETATLHLAGHTNGAIHSAPYTTGPRLTLRGMLAGKDCVSSYH